MVSDSISVSQSSTLKRCAQLYMWRYADNLRERDQAVPLWFGIGIHEALAEWYLLGKKRGPYPAETWLKYCEDEEKYVPMQYEDDEKQWLDAKQLGVTMLTGYVDKYGKDERWHMIATEQGFRKAVPPRPHRVLKKGMVKLGDFMGYIDGVYRDLEDGTVWLLEHKTAAKITTTHLQSDPQATRYLYVAAMELRKQGLIKSTDAIQGIHYNFLRKQIPQPDDRIDENGVAHNKPTKAQYIEALVGQDGMMEKELKKLKVDELDALSKKYKIKVWGDISADQPAHLFHRERVSRTTAERWAALEEIQADMEYKAGLLNGTIPVTSNWTRECTWCPFYRMHILKNAGEDWEEYRDEKFTVRPAAPREEKKAA